MIKDLKGKYLSLWWDTPAKVHKIDEKISLVEKLKNEKRIETFRKQLFTTLKQVPEDKDNQEAWKIKVMDQLRSMELSLSHYDISIVDFFIDSGYGNVTEEFINEQFTKHKSKAYCNRKKIHCPMIRILLELHLKKEVHLY